MDERLSAHANGLAARAAEHEAEQAAITQLCESGACEHGSCANWPAHYSGDDCKVERDIVLALLNEVLRRGWSISVYDGEDWPVRESTNLRDITTEIAATGETLLHIFTTERGENGRTKKLGMVYLVHGNDEDVIADHTDNEDMTGLVDAVRALVEAGEAGDDDDVSQMEVSASDICPLMLRIVKLDGFMIPDDDTPRHVMLNYGIALMALGVAMLDSAGASDDAETMAAARSMEKVFAKGLRIAAEGGEAAKG